MTLLIVTLYLIVSILISATGYNTYGEGLKIFMLSLLLTPFAGLIYLLVKKKRMNRIRFYHCHHCEYVFPVKMTHCPICEERGYKIKLKKFKSPHYVGNQIHMLIP